MNRIRAVVPLLVVVAASDALADQRESSVSVSLAPVYAWVADSIDGTASQGSLGGSVQLTWLYGVTHSLHVGLSLSGSMRSAHAYAGKVVVLDDGSRPTGTLTQSPLAVGGAAVLAWRFNTGQRWAPVLSVEGGYAYQHYRNVSFKPDRTGIVFEYPSLTECRPFVRGIAAVEFRLGNQFAVTAGVAVRRAFQSLTNLEVSLPLSAALVFW